MVFTVQEKLKGKLRVWVGEINIPASVIVSHEGTILFEHQLTDPAALNAERRTFVVLLSHFEQFVQDHFGIGIGELCADSKQ